MAQQYDTSESSVEKLFAHLAEQVKLPFTQISQAAQLMDINDSSSLKSNQQTIEDISQNTIRLIDGFLLNLKLQNESQMRLEPVPVSSVLYDVAELLSRFAKHNDCRLEIDVAGKFAPVMAHKKSLLSALVNLGNSFISANDSSSDLIKLAVRRNSIGVSVGVYSSSPMLSSSLLKQSKKMSGTVYQPMAAFASHSAAGVFVADSLLANMGSEMKVSRLGGMHGLAATLLPSRQLSLI